ncbi:MAG: hypothetical protein GWN00_33975, partial [Aliifodinibius sp.]|nr:hypothetical protein [Fodinibius sp.]NIV11609.1 hypothetical protein [Fodinibius sp.]NIY29616.1 hypothetical protein [Fodinibius sp.]
MNKITFVLGILIVIGLVPLNHSQSNPIIPPWISEFSTNPDWIEFTTEGMDNWEYVYFHVNGQLVTVNPGVYTNDD